jgi:hypothetical protein
MALPYVSNLLSSVPLLWYHIVLVHTKVDQLEFTIVAPNKVFGLDVAMHDAFAVAILDSRCCLSEDLMCVPANQAVSESSSLSLRRIVTRIAQQYLCGFGFDKAFSSDGLVQVSVRSVLGDDIDAIGVLEAIE